MSSYEFYLPALLRLPLRLGVGVYGLFIIWASVRPAGTGGAIPHLDKVLHLGVYGLLAGSLVLAWPKLSKLRIFWGCVLFGIALEVAQGLMGAGRTASLLDVIANSLGAALGVYVVALLVQKFAR